MKDARRAGWKSKVSIEEKGGFKSKLTLWEHSKAHNHTLCQFLTTVARFHDDEVDVYAFL